VIFKFNSSLLSAASSAASSSLRPNKVLNATARKRAAR
jgi:hypothetical protein